MGIKCDGEVRGKDSKDKKAGWRWCNVEFMRERGEVVITN